MSSSLNSLTPQKQPYGAIVLRIPGRLPSWNEILGMEQWARYKFKQELETSFLSVFKASGSDCSTKIICAKNSMSIAYDTLASYRQMRLDKRKLKQRNARLLKAKKSTLKL